MLFFRASLAWVLCAALAASSAAAASVHHRASAGSHHSASAGSHSNASSSGHSKHRVRKMVSRLRHPRGQQAIQPERVIEIQQALIREHYLSGEASGKWDETTQAAMRKYQADQGWQTKLAPDSRALKKLGLGPDYSNAINAKSSNFAAPPPAGTIPPVQAAGFAAAAGVR